MSLLDFLREYLTNIVDYRSIYSIYKRDLYYYYLIYCRDNELDRPPRGRFYLEIFNLNLPIFISGDDFRFIPSQVLEFIESKY